MKSRALFSLSPRSPRLRGRPTFSVRANCRSLCALLAPNAQKKLRESRPIKKMLNRFSGVFSDSGNRRARLSVESRTGRPCWWMTFPTRQRGDAIERRVGLPAGTTCDLCGKGRAAEKITKRTQFGCCSWPGHGLRQKSDRNRDVSRYGSRRRAMRGALVVCRAALRRRPKMSEDVRFWPGRVRCAITERRPLPASGASSTIIAA